MIYEEMSPARARKKVGKGQKPRQGAILSQALPKVTLANPPRERWGQSSPDDSGAGGAVVTYKCPPTSQGCLFGKLGCPCSTAERKWLWQPECSPSAKSHRPSGGKAHWMPTSVQMATRLEGRVPVVSATVTERYSTV